MPDVKLVAQLGRPRGTGSSRRLRHAGRIPAVVYGHGIDPMAVDVDARSLRSVLSTEAGNNVVVELEVDGDHHLAMAKDIQRHPVRGTVAHVDFLVVNRNETVTVDVPIALIGEATEIQHAGGTVGHELFTLSVQTTPGNIPTAIEVDVSALTVGGSIRVGDLTMPHGVTTEVDPDAAVVIGHAAVVVEVAEAEVEEAEGGAETPETTGPAEASDQAGA